MNNHERLRATIYTLIATLSLTTPRKSAADDRLDIKTLYYQESDGRMRVVSPTLLYEHELSTTMKVKLDGIYNSISGATPSGAPPLKTTTTYRTVTTATPPTSGNTYEDDDRNDDRNDDREDEDDDKSRGKFRRILHNYPGGYMAKAGATPAPRPAPTPSGGGSTSSGGGVNTTTVADSKVVYDKAGKAPRAQVDDERFGVNLELTKVLDNHTVAAQISLSNESDYTSQALALRNSIDFNQKNTTLLLGVSYAHDVIDATTMESSETKDSLDGMIGVTQVLDKKTTFSINLTLGTADGFLTDPYKVVELNGSIVPEKRPDSRTKSVLFLALNRYVDSLNGAAELSYRYYDDSFGVKGQTFGFSWYQKLSPHWTLRPSVRYYTQTAADFYDIQFSGSPSYYSSDYRVSEMSAIGYGMKLIWFPTDKLSFDIAVDRYVQSGEDGITADDMYPEALSVMAGLRIWF